MRGSELEIGFDEKRDELIFDLAQKSLHRQWGRISDLDSKAANQVGFIGVVIGFVLGDATLMQARLMANGLLLGLFVLSILVLLISFWFGIRGFMVREWTIVPNPLMVIRKYAESSYERLLIAVGGEMAKVEQEARLRNDERAVQIRWSSYSMLFGLVLAFIFVLLSVMVG